MIDTINILKSLGHEKSRRIRFGKQFLREQAVGQVAKPEGRRKRNTRSRGVFPLAINERKLVSSGKKRRTGQETRLQRIHWWSTVPVGSKTRQIGRIFSLNFRFTPNLIDASPAGVYRVIQTVRSYFCGKSLQLDVAALPWESRRFRLYALHKIWFPARTVCATVLRRFFVYLFFFRQRHGPWPVRRKAHTARARAADTIRHNYYDGSSSPSCARALAVTDRLAERVATRNLFLVRWRHVINK